MYSTSMSTHGTPLDVYVEMMGELFRAQVFVDGSTRLQDIMNDSRAFLPVKVKVDGKNVFMMINKQQIYKIYEV